MGAFGDSLANVYSDNVQAALGLKTNKDNIKQRQRESFIDSLNKGITLAAGLKQASDDRKAAAALQEQRDAAALDRIVKSDELQTRRALEERKLELGSDKNALSMMATIGQLTEKGLLTKEQAGIYLDNLQEQRLRNNDSVRALAEEEYKKYMQNQLKGPVAGQGLVEVDPINPADPTIFKAVGDTSPIQAGIKYNDGLQGQDLTFESLTPTLDKLIKAARDDEIMTDDLAQVDSFVKLAERHGSKVEAEIAKSLASAYKAQKDADEKQRRDSLISSADSIAAQPVGSVLVDDLGIPASITMNTALKRDLTDRAIDFTETTSRNRRFKERKKLNDGAGTIVRFAEQANELTNIISRIPNLDTINVKASVLKEIGENFSIESMQELSFRELFKDLPPDVRVQGNALANSLDGTLASIARLKGEVGVLTDKDIARYQRLIQDAGRSGKLNVMALMDIQNELLTDLSDKLYGDVLFDTGNRVTEHLNVIRADLGKPQYTYKGGYGYKAKSSTNRATSSPVTRTTSGIKFSKETLDLARGATLDELVEVTGDPVSAQELFNAANR